jgi:hypothetical protein
VLLSFDVGVTERHHVQFSVRRFRGASLITVDGVDAVRVDHLDSPKQVARWELVVGEGERHEVRIEKHRKRRLARLRTQIVCAFVDGRLVAQSRV